MTGLTLKRGHHGKRVALRMLGVSVACVIGALSLSVMANERAPAPYSISVSRIAVGAADIGDSGYDLQRDTWLLGAKARFALNRQWSVSVNGHYDKLEYDWGQRGGSLLNNYLGPWSDVERYGAGFGISYRPNRHWMFLFAPKVQYAYTEDVSASNAQSYGVVASGMYRFNNGNMLGLGVAYLNDISEVRTLPYLAVNWQITEQLKLGNPFSAGFSGPAGLELSYQLTKSVDLGVGASKRTQRFLVKDEDTTVEVDEWVSFVRMGWQVSQPLSVNGYLGYYFNGEIELSQPDSRESIENQIALAFSVQYQF